MVLSSVPPSTPIVFIFSASALSGLCTGCPSQPPTGHAWIPEVGTCLYPPVCFSFTMTPVAHRYKSNEEYVYVRGRGRGKYVCEECGIRCKKPSMLKKHIRTHTDVRPYVCKHCHFAFKTKGKRQSRVLPRHCRCSLLGAPSIELRGHPLPGSWAMPPLPRFTLATSISVFSLAMSQFLGSTYGHAHFLGSTHGQAPWPWLWPSWNLHT